MKWDNDIAFRPETWAALGEHLYPGAFGMAFASSRGWHRMAVAIEDAGFVLHPSVFLWAFGSGFPKATRIDTQIDKAAGATREKFIRTDGGSGGGSRVFDDDNFEWNRQFEDSIPSTSLAKNWAGHRYGLQAMKPAVEPIIVFQKPYEGKPIDNIVTTGAGALNIDGARIGTDNIPSNQFVDGAKPFGNGAGHKYQTVQNNGRWPSNFIVDEITARLLNKQSGIRKSGNLEPGHVRGDGANVPYGGGGVIQRSYGGDEGGASRYFYNVHYALDEADPVFYSPKANGKERDAGLELHATRVAGGMQARTDGSLDGKVTLRKNFHPTCKPLALTQHLATLLLPPDAYSPRRLLVPFSGSGSEMIGALLAGWEHIQGVELSEEYAQIARARLVHWAKQPAQNDTPTLPGFDI